MLTPIITISCFLALLAPIRSQQAPDGPEIAVERDEGDAEETPPEDTEGSPGEPTGDAPGTTEEEEEAQDPELPVDANADEQPEEENLDVTPETPSTTTPVAVVPEDDLADDPSETPDQDPTTSALDPPQQTDPEPEASPQPQVQNPQASFPNNTDGTGDSESPNGDGTLAVDDEDGDSGSESEVNPLNQEIDSEEPAEDENDQDDSLAEDQDDEEPSLSPVTTSVADNDDDQDSDDQDSDQDEEPQERRVVVQRVSNNSNEENEENENNSDENGQTSSSSSDPQSNDQQGGSAEVTDGEPEAGQSTTESAEATPKEDENISTTVFITVGSVFAALLVITIIICYLRISARQSRIRAENVSNLVTADHVGNGALPWIHQKGFGVNTSIHSNPSSMGRDDKSLLHGACNGPNRNPPAYQQQQMGSRGSSLERQMLQAPAHYFPHQVPNDNHMAGYPIPTPVTQSPESQKSQPGVYKPNYGYDTQNRWNANFYNGSSPPTNGMYTPDPPQPTFPSLSKDENPPSTTPEVNFAQALSFTKLDAEANFKHGPDCEAGNGKDASKSDDSLSHQVPYERNGVYPYAKD